MKVLVNNQLIEYKDEGSGRVVLLLHGWGTNLGTFDQLAGHLAQYFRVIRFDFPGFGQSPKPTDDWSVSDYARLTCDILEKLKVSGLHAVIAHSFGGRVAIKGVSQGYLEPTRIVLIGAAGVKPNSSIRTSLYKSVAKDRQNRHFFATYQPGSTSATQASACRGRQYRLSTVRTDAKYISQGH